MSFWSARCIILELLLLYSKINLDSKMKLVKKGSMLMALQQSILPAELRTDVVTDNDSSEPLILHCVFDLIRHQKWKRRRA